LQHYINKVLVALILNVMCNRELMIKGFLASLNFIAILMDNNGFQLLRAIIWYYHLKILPLII